MQRLCRLYLHGLPCRIPNAHHHHQRYQQPSCQRAYQEAYHAPLHRPGGNQCGTSNGELANAYVVTYQHGRQSNQRQQRNPSPIRREKTCCLVLPIANRKAISERRRRVRTQKVPISPKKTFPKRNSTTIV